MVDESARGTDSHRSRQRDPVALQQSVSVSVMRMMSGGSVQATRISFDVCMDSCNVMDTSISACSNASHVSHGDIEHALVSMNETA